MEKLVKLAEKLNCVYAQNESMSLHTTFKIGGNARLIVYPKNENDVAQFVKLANVENVRIISIGNGSNLLVDDGGLDACVMILGDAVSQIKFIDSETIYAGAGALLIKVCNFALKNSMTGLEFAYGIPGTVGGGAYMNAGAYGSSMQDVIIRCDHIDKDGNLGYLEGDDLKLSYRSSAYNDNGCIITGVYIKLKKGDKAQIKEKMNDLISRRKEKQPLEYPSAGSVFKRPTGYFAGALIEECGLKGKSIGGAMVSEKHAGFIINTGGATCDDVLQLCKYCQETVYNEKGVMLEPEIKVTK